MNGAYRTLIAALLLLCVRAPLAAQDTVAVGVRTPPPPGEELPDRVADQLVAFYNRTSTIRFSGRTRIPAGQSITGDVAILGGPVEIAGVVDGNLVVLNGDITLVEGSRVGGELTVVGGVVFGAEHADVDGVITTYTAIFRYRRTEEGIEYLGSQPSERAEPSGRTLTLPSWQLGSSEIFVSARAYNRIEALPIAIGPRIQTGGRNPLRLNALLIYRTQGGFNPNESNLGYQVNVRQWLGGRRAFWIEGGIRSIIDPIERWKFSNLENSLSLFLFRQDYRDYYKREGWYGLLGWNSGTLFGSLEYIDERQGSVKTNNVWTILFNKNEPLGPNADINLGDLQSVKLTLGIDTRNDEERPQSGWYSVLGIEQAVDGDLSGRKPDFTAVSLDLRRYLRVSQSSVVAFRVVGGGPIGSDRTPAQREHVIGGAGSLPGYNMLQFDCGARERPTFGELPGYGCQRFALFQAEYITGLDLRWRWDQDQDASDIQGDIFSVDFNPALVLFYDAGAAWSTGENYWDHLTKSDNWVADLGAGLAFGGFGFYVAYPLTGTGGFNFVVRLKARF